MNKQTGFTLIEIMVSLLIGFIVIAATLSLYITSIRGTSNIAQSARLNHDMDSALALMVNDIRRAGYWGGAMIGSDSRDNPFTVSGTTDLQIPAADCVLYTYDANGDSAVDANEYYGFRVNNSNIQMRSSNIGCNDNGWESLNVNEGNAKVNITALTLTESYKCLRKRNDTADATFDTTCADAVTAGNIITDDRVIETREIDITLTGEVDQDNTVTKTVSGQVKIRNDRVFSQT